MLQHIRRVSVAWIAFGGVAAAWLLGPHAVHAIPVFPPACPEPAPYHAAPPCCASNYHIVLLDNEADAIAVTAELEAKYGFEASEVFTDALEAFIAILTPEQIAGLRCEPLVVIIEEDYCTSFPDGRPIPCFQAVEIPTLSLPAQLILFGALLSTGLFIMARRRVETPSAGSDTSDQ